MNWKDRQRIAHESYRPYDRSKSVDVTKLRRDIFGSHKIPLDADFTITIDVLNTRGQLIAHTRVMVKPSKCVGENKTRGGRGHRMFVMCPGCTGGPCWIPVGRLHQHYGYKHPVE